MLHSIMKTVKNEEISASTGAYFEQINGIHIYQNTAPILYTLRIQRNFEVDEIRSKVFNTRWDGNNVIIADKDQLRIKTLLNNLEEIGKMNDAIFQEFELKKEAMRRRKRGLQFIGSALQWCCNVMTVRDGRSMLKNQLSLKKAYEDARQVILQSHAELINVTSDLKRFATDAATQMNILNDAIEKDRSESDIQRRYLFSKARYIEIHDNIANIFTTATVANTKLTYLFLSCKNNHVPSAIVERETFLKDLLKIKKAAINNGMELAINENDLNTYFHAKIVTCTTFEDDLEIEVKVPLKKIGGEFSLHEFVPITFRSHDNKLCSWEQEPAVIIYEENEKTVKVATGTEMDKCNTNDPICYVPQGRGTSNKAACAAALFLEKPYKEMLKACSLKCEEDHGNTIVKQIGEEKFAITNGRKRVLITNTANNTKWESNLEEKWPGMVIMKVPCEIKVEQVMEDGKIEVLIPAGMPCIRKTNPQIIVKHHLPVVWTTLGDMEIKGGFEQSFTFRNIATAYDPKWAEKVPYFTTVTPIKDLEKRLKDVEINIPDMTGGDTINWLNIIFIVWCSALSFVVALLVLREICRTVKEKVSAILPPQGEANVAGTLADLAMKVVE